jgi:hypothetical protein
MNSYVGLGFGNTVCTRAVFLNAKGTTTWSLTVKRKVPKGAYTIVVRVRDAAGTVQPRAATRKLRVK